MTESIDRILGRLEEKVDRLIEDREETNERLAKVEEVTNEYRAIKTLGRGYLIGAALGGGGFGLWLHDTVVPFFKGLRG